MKLKPCPHCGGEAELREAMGEYWVSCLEPSCSEMWGTEDKAVKIWNKRVAPEKTIKRVLVILEKNIDNRERTSMSEYNDGFIKELIRIFKKEFKVKE